MKGLLFALICTFFLFGCLSGEHLVVSQSSGAQTGAATNAITGTSSGDDGADSRAYWKATSPIAMTAWKYSGNELKLILKNQDSSKITITDIAIDGLLFEVSDNSLYPGELIEVNASMLIECGNLGDSFSLRGIRITYDKGGISGFTQVGTKPIIGTCN